MAVPEPGRVMWPAVAALVISFVFITGCAFQAPATPGEPTGAAVTILPQAEMVRAIGGEKVCVTVVVPPGTDPHTFEISASQLVRISRMDIYFRVGPGILPFEDQLVTRIRQVNPEMTIIDCSANVSLLSDEESHAGEDGKNYLYDPHIWLSTVNARIMAENICAGFREADPENALGYTARKEQYQKEIDATEEAIRSELSGKEGRRFLVFHPAWGYFARDFGLIQVPVEVEGKEPTARELSQLISLARSEGIQVVFAEPQFSTRGSEVIAGEINGTVVLIDPLAPDYLANMKRVAAALAGSY